MRAVAVGPRAEKKRQPAVPWLNQPESELIRLTVGALDASFTENTMWKREGVIEAMLKDAEKYIVIYTNCSGPTMMTMNDKDSAEAGRGKYSRAVDISLRSFLTEERNSKRLEEGETEMIVTAGSYPKWPAAEVKLEPYGSPAGIYHPGVHIYMELFPLLA